MACIWYFIVSHGPSDLKSAVEAKGMNYSESYMYSLYFILVTLVTVGYGDIIPQSNLEIFFTMVAEFLGILVFAYMMGKISAFLLSSTTQDAQTKQFELDKWLLRLDKSRLDKKLPTEVHIYMKNYYDYIWRNDFSEFTNSDYVHRLPAKLREKLIHNLFGFMIDRYSLFFSNCELKFCHSILTNMYPRRFQYDEEIVSIDQDVTDVYFINSGSVAVGTKRGCQRFLRLPMSSFFGEEFVIFDSISPMAFIADSGGVEILCIRKEAFMNSLIKYPKCFNKISAMAFRRGTYFRSKMYKSIKTREYFSPIINIQKARTGLDLLIYNRNDAIDLLARLEETPDTIPEDLLDQMRTLRQNSESTQPTPQTELIERLLTIIQKYEKRVKKQQRVSEKLLSAHRILLEDFYTVSSGLESSNYSKVIRTIKKRLRVEPNF